MAGEREGGDLRGLHRALDRPQTQLRRGQSQVGVAAASQPWLMQVAQEAAIKDLVGQLGGVQEKLAEDPHLQELMMRMMDRVQEDLGGPEELAKLISGLGFPM